MDAVDARVHEYARLIVDRSLDVQPGWQVLIRAQPAARPLIEELMRMIGARGAYPLLRMNFSMYPKDEVWASEAPLELVGEMAPIDRFAADHMDARVTVEAPDNICGVAELSPERRALMTKAAAPFFRRTMTDEIPWVVCVYPTDALAQEAGMSLSAFEDFLYEACLRDWDAEGKTMERLLARFDSADSVRIVGAETDLTLSLKGRRGEIDNGHANLPGGEFYYAPIEDSAEGTVYFDVPTEYNGAPVSGIRFTFRNGRIEEASAEHGEPELLAALDLDEGARFLGELGIGCNTGITQPMRNIGFDEKMAGTIHLAVGRSYTSVGGKNESVLHWDLVKDLRDGGRIELDDEVVQENGTWLI